MMGTPKTVEDNALPAGSAMVVGFIDRSFLCRGWRFQRVPHLLRSAISALACSGWSCSFLA
jgi:hypothetical protein